MFDQPTTENAVAAIRVSTTRQGREGDSPEAQREQIEQFARHHGISLKKVFVFLESASKDAQPMQPAIDYCKEPKNDVQLFIVKSIDRFTRGGATPYDQLKMQLARYGVKLVDIYGVINTTKINTLEHLGLSYRWSEYYPSQKSEFLEAERAKDELRDIMSRMIGAEVRYTRLGYWMRRPPYGFTSVRTDTPNGKRYILEPDPKEAEFIRMMYSLRTQGNMTDQEIVDELNRLGFRSRQYYRRSPDDPNQLVASLGGKKLTLKRYWIYITSPIYAGVLREKWTNYEPVKCAFDGLVSIETWNQANKGKITIREAHGEYTITKQDAPAFQTSKGSRSNEYAYRKVVTCSVCASPLYGSAAKGKYKYYPGYHCNKRGHYFRVPKDQFEETIARFTQSIAFSQNHVDDLVSAVETVWNKRQQELGKEAKTIDQRIAALQAQAKAIVDKMMLVRSESAIKYLEEDLMKIEEEITQLSYSKSAKKEEEPTNMDIIMQYIRYFLEHLDYLLLKQIDPIKKANFFGILFDKTPTYQEILSGTQDLTNLTGINQLFSLKNLDQSSLVRVTRL